MKINLLPKQYEIMTSKATQIVFAASRGAGKSVVAAWFAVRELKSGNSGMVIAPIFDDLRAVMVKYICEFLENTNTPYQHNKSEHWVKVKNSILYYRSSESENGIRGRSDLSFLIVDEAATVDYDIYLIAKACLRGANVRNPKTLLIGTPRGKNWFYDAAFREGTHLVHAKTTENTYLDTSFYEDLKAVYSGEFARQELEGEFIDNDQSNVFLDSEWKMFARKINGMGNQIIVGLDVAAGGDDSASAVYRGNQLINVVAKKTTTDISTLIDLCRVSLGGLAPNYILIDSTGIGTFAPAEFQKVWKDAKVIGVNFGAKANKKGYALRRDEIYFDLKKKINQGWTISSSIDEKIVKQIEKEFYATEYGINKNRDFKLIPKSEIKSKIGRSPDMLDAICLGASLDMETIEKLSKINVPQQFNYPNRK